MWSYTFLVPYTPPRVHVHSAQTARSPTESMLVHTDYVESVCTPHGLCGVLASPCGLCMTAHKNCTEQGLNQSLATARSMLNHCTMVAWYVMLTCAMCDLWLNWEIYLLLFNMAHMIYVLDQFSDGNSTVVSVL